MRKIGHTVGETAAFLKFAKANLSEVDHERLKRELALDPTKGEVIPGTGGVRKYRFAATGSGKRGGFRIITYYYNESMPVYLLTGYAKSERISLSDDDKKLLRRTTSKIKAAAKRRK